MYRDDIKVFAKKQKTKQKKKHKNEKAWEVLIQTIRIYNQDIGIEFGIEKYVILIMKSGKTETTEGIELPNKESIRTLGERKTTITWVYWKQR